MSLCRQANLSSLSLQPPPSCPFSPLSCFLHLVRTGSLLRQVNMNFGNVCAVTGNGKHYFELWGILGLISNLEPPQLLLSSSH